MSMRIIVAGAAALAVVAAAASAGAQSKPVVTESWTSKDQVFSLVRPKAWEMEDKSNPGSQNKLYVTGTAIEECWVSQLPRSNAEKVSVDTVKRFYEQPIGAEKWVETAKGFPFVGPTPTVDESAVETIADWPVQTATLSGKEGKVYAALHARPSVEIQIYCLGYDEKDRSAALKAIARSVSTPKDAELLANAAAASQAAPPAAPPAPEPKKKR